MTETEHQPTDKGCGITHHRWDCLCDVQMTVPTTIEFDPSTFWMCDVVWNSEVIADGGPQALLDFLEKMTLAYDAVRELQERNEQADKLRGKVSASIRGYALAALRDGHSMVDLPDLLQVSYADIISSITNGSPSPLWAWGDLEWLKFEAWAAERAQVGQREIGREFGIKYNVAERLIAMYGLTKRLPKEHWGKRVEHFLQHDPDAPVKNVVEFIESEGGTMSYNAVGKIRSRMKKQGRLPADKAAWKPGCGEGPKLLGDIHS